MTRDLSSEQKAKIRFGKGWDLLSDEIEKTYSSVISKFIHDKNLNVPELRLIFCMECR